MKQLLLIFFALSVFFFIRNILLLAFHMENIKVHKRRIKQLKFERNKEKGQMDDLIDTVTKPIVEVLFPKLNIFEFEDVEKELKYARWKISAQQFTALKLLAKIMGVVLFLVFKAADATPAGVVWLAILFFIPQILLSNSSKNRRESIMLEFPDFIRITQGYLTANLTFEQAVAEAAPFMNKDWQEILRGFETKAQLENLDAALEYLKEEVGTMEVKEFISIVRLTLEQGGRARDSFEKQAEKIQQMLYDMMLIKINRRKIYGVLIQSPLLLCNMAVLGLPVAESFMSMGF